METIQDLASLRRIVGEPRPLTKLKIHSRLNEQAREYIRRSPLMMLSTADASGEPTVSPKGDFPGFVRVEDDRTLHIPERKGNKLIFSLQNILRNPNVGLLFLVPGSNETLRVQGTARLTADEEPCRALSSRGNPAVLVTVVTVKECYFHCAKAFLRGSVWNPETWSEPIRVSFGREIACNTEMSTEQIDELDAGVQGRYVTDL